MTDAIFTPRGLMLHIDWRALPAAAQKAILAALCATPGQPVPSAAADAEAMPAETYSYPLNVLQARKLLDGVDQKTRNFLVELVKDYDEAEFAKWESAWISYDSAWALAGAANKSDFARSILAGVQRRLRSVVDDREASLVFAYDEGGPEGEGSYYIDDWSAVKALRQALIDKPRQ